jgi:hypothetical protein
MARVLNRNLPERYRAQETYSILQIIRGIKIKTTVRCHFTSIMKNRK